jgi:hypothetical protein
MIVKLCGELVVTQPQKYGTAHDNCWDMQELTSGAFCGSEYSSAMDRIAPVKLEGFVTPVILK